MLGPLLTNLLSISYKSSSTAEELTSLLDNELLTGFPAAHYHILKGLNKNPNTPSHLKPYIQAKIYCLKLQ